MAFFERANADPFAHINAKIASAQAELENAYSALGKAYFAAHGSDAEDALSQNVAAIVTAQKKEEIYRELLVRARGVKICPQGSATSAARRSPSRSRSLTA